MMISVRPHHERAEIIRAGAAAARDGVHRRHNPYPLAEEDWLNWMDGYDQQTVWLEQKRGVYDPFPEVLSTHHAVAPRNDGQHRAASAHTGESVQRDA